LLGTNVIKKGARSTQVGHNAKKSSRLTGGELIFFKAIFAMPMAFSF